MMDSTGTTKGGSIALPLTSCLTGLDWSVLQIKTEIVSCHTADSKPVKLEVNGTVILPSLVFLGFDQLGHCHNRDSDSTWLGFLSLGNTSPAK